MEIRIDIDAAKAKTASEEERNEFLTALFFAASKATSDYKAHVDFSDSHHWVITFPDEYEPMVSKMFRSPYQRKDIGWHEFVPGTICNVKMCDRCDEPYDNPVHHTGVVPNEETERVLRRRRTLMPDYDRKLEEWLS